MHTNASQYLILPNHKHIGVLDKSTPDLYEDIQTVAKSFVEIAPGIVAGFQHESDAPPITITRFNGFESDGFTPIYHRYILHSYLFFVCHAKCFKGEMLSLEGLKSIVSFDDEPTLQEKQQLLAPLKDHSVEAWSRDNDSEICVPIVSDKPLSSSFCNLVAATFVASTAFLIVAIF